MSEQGCKLVKKENDLNGIKKQLKFLSELCILISETLQKISEINALEFPLEMEKIGCGLLRRGSDWRN